VAFFFPHKTPDLIALVHSDVPFAAGVPVIEPESESSRPPGELTKEYGGGPLNVRLSKPPTTAILDRSH
jgi:hypothetical protein